MKEEIKINLLWILMIIILIILFGIFIVIDNTKHNKKEYNIIHDTIYVNVIDTLIEKEYINKLDNINKEFINYKDSINKELDSLKSENFINKYKLERIKYYTDISNGTNIKYLRGWIYRTLKD